MKRVKVEIEGVAPLLQHKMPEEDVNKPSRKHQDKKDNPEDFLYKTGRKICQPASHIERAMQQTASKFKIVGRGKKTYKDAAKTVIVEPDMIEHSIQKWEPYSASVVIPSTRGRVMRIRPMLKKWKLSFTMLWDEKLIPKSVLKDMLDSAGAEVGIGDWRPRFGRFMVTSFKEAK